MSVLLGILCGIISMVGYGLNNGISKKLIKELGVKNALFFRFLFTSLLYIVLLVFFFPTNFSLNFILSAVGIAIIGYFAITSFYKGLEKGKANIISPIASSSVIFTVLFSVLFFSEVITTIHIFSIGLIFLGVILISTDIRNLKILIYLNSQKEYHMRY